IDNPKDNYAVGQRILADYEQRWPNDPARVATAYFSGPGNVAGPGSTTPWVHDYQDANGKNVSGYVSDGLDRMGAPEAIGVAAQYRAHQAVEAAYQAKQKALASDPAGYVLANRPDIAAQVAPLGSSQANPEMVQQGIQASLIQQRSLGVQNPQVLSKDQAN